MLESILNKDVPFEDDVLKTFESQYDLSVLELQ